MPRASGEGVRHDSPRDRSPARWRRWQRPPLRRHRRRPGRADRGLPAGQGRPARHRAGGRRAGRRPGQDRRRSRGLPLRPRRAPLLHQERRGQRPLARDHGRRVPHAPAHVAHLLARALPRLPAQGHRRHQEARPGRARALHAELHVGRDEAQGPRGQPRDLGLQPLRQAPVHALLQELHREGLGRPRHRGARRVGRPAHQGPELLQRRQGRLLRQQGQQDQVADRQVPVPPLRPGPDVGDDDRPHRGARRRGPAEHAGHAPGVRGRRVRRRPHARRDHRARGRHLVAAAARHRRHHRSRLRRRASPRPPRACATATS